MLYAAFSGGKDSTAMVLRLAENAEPFECLYTPTGDEPPEVAEHITRTVREASSRLHVVTPGFGLHGRIRHYNAIPNFRQRWCTREIKIEPCKAFLLARPGSTLAVALRADEESRGFDWEPFATLRYPLQEWGWGLSQVMDYLEARRVCVPSRTDCELCFFQRLSEWWLLWKERPEKFAQGEALEEMTGHTFRSPGRDSWPAALADLRREFEAGRTPRGIRELPLLDEYEADTRKDMCR